MNIGNLYGFININGEFVIEPIYKRAEDFSIGLAFIMTTDGKKGFINCDNKMILP